MSQHSPIMAWSFLLALLCTQYVLISTVTDSNKQRILDHSPVRREVDNSSEVCTRRNLQLVKEENPATN